MDNVIARVATAANLSPDVARKIVALIVDFIQREASEDAVQGSVLQGAGAAGDRRLGRVDRRRGHGVSLKGLMGIAAGAMGGGGLMALGGELMGLGLSMDQIQTAGREVFAYAREVAGDQTIGEITASIPGLAAVHLRGSSLGRGRDGVFPAWSEADWRKAAEAALKGASLDRLASSTADGIADRAASMRRARAPDRCGRTRPGV